MADVLLSFVGWTFVPLLATRFAQSAFYGVSARAGTARPAPGSAAWLNHHRRIHITIILAYLLYTIYEAYQSIQRAGDFYKALGVPHDVDEKGIKTRFRKLAAQHHPDKVAPGDYDVPLDSVFVQLKLAQDTLLNPASRFAYDRFGPVILTWQHCSTISDYLSAGFISTGPGYVASGMFMAMLGMMGYLQWGRFWRYLAGAGLMLLEIYTVSRPYFPTILTTFINPTLSGTFSEPKLLPFQFLILARKVNVAIFIAIAQLGSHFQSADATAHNDSVPLGALAHLEHMARSTEVEAARLLDLNMAPFASNTVAVKNLKERVREWLVQNTIKADPVVREAVGSAMQQRSGEEAG